MCKAFKQSQFLLKFKMKNKGNGKNTCFPQFLCSSGYIFAALDIKDRKKITFIVRALLYTGCNSFYFSIWVGGAGLVCNISSCPARSKDCTSVVYLCEELGKK